LFSCLILKNRKNNFTPLCRHINFDSRVLCGVSNLSQILSWKIDQNRVIEGYDVEFFAVRLFCCVFITTFGSFVG
jgi:hypothetical protein